VCNAFYLDETFLIRGLFDKVQPPSTRKIQAEKHGGLASHPIVCPPQSWTRSLRTDPSPRRGAAAALMSEQGPSYVDNPPPPRGGGFKKALPAALENSFRSSLRRLTAGRGLWYIRGKGPAPGWSPAAFVFQPRTPTGYQAGSTSIFV